jgi:CHAT domain-containing protein
MERTALAASVLAAPTAARALALVRDLDAAARTALVEELAALVLHSIRVDARQALAVAEREALVAAGDPRLAARAQWSRGHALVSLARHAEAAAHYAGAAAAYKSLGEPRLAARTALGHIDALMYLGRYDRAIAVGKAARKVLVGCGDERSVYSLDQNLGNILHRTDRPAAALRAYNRALASARRRGDASACRWIEYNRANVLTSLGRTAEAAAGYRKTRAAALAAGETRVVALVDYSLGYLELQQSEYGRAYAMLDAARSAFEALGDTRYLALCHLDLAELLLEINSFVRARHQARRARTLFDELGQRYESAKATLFLAVAALGEGADARAADLIAEAARAFRREGNRAAEALCDLFGGELDRRGGKRRAAERRLERAEERFTAERLKLRAAAAALRRAGLAVERRDPAGAAEHLDRARRFLRGLESPWLRAQHDHLRGRLHVLAGEPRRALASVKRAVAGIESVRRRIGGDEFRVSYAADKAPVYADLVELILRTRSGERAVSESFAVVERARSRALVDLLAGRLAGAFERLDPRGQALRRRLERLRGEAAWLAGAGGGTGDGSGEKGRRDETRLGRSRARLRACESEIADIMQRLARRDSALGALTQGETITLAEVQAALAGDTALVEYFFTPERTLAFVVERERTRVVTLAATTDRIAAAIARLRFQIEKWGYGDDYVRGREGLLLAGIRQHLTEIAAMVWWPLAVDAPRLLIVPHGPLHSLPFHALPLAGAPPAAGSALVDHAEISYLPSASTIRYLRSPVENGGIASALVVGVEDERIPKVREEVDRVEGLFAKKQVLRNREATLAAFSAAAGEADYLHVAAHAIFREDDPHFSALRLADGWLSLYDIYGLRLKARLVSLSACQSGRSWVGGGDEMVGLVRGFLYAGAASLVVSLWPVHDTTTADLMGEFYAALHRGEPAPAALRTAMLRVRAVHPHPYHWASFVLVGAGGLAPVPAVLHPHSNRGRNPAASAEARM